MRKFMIPALLTAALVAGCGGGSELAGSGSSSGSSSGSGSGSGSGGSKTTLAMGSGTGTGFQSGTIAINTTSLSAGGSTTLQVSIVDQTGALYTQSTSITFSSPCQGQGLASIVATPASGSTPASASVTTTTGTATATYTATGCSGSDLITASATANSQALKASGTVMVAAAAIGSIQFVSANPSQITLKGVGASGGSATSTVIFKVVDTSGGPRAGATVTFSLNTTVGGISLSPTSAQSGANGEVQTIVSSGTQATTVRVTATTTTTTGVQISTESNALTVSTGIPTSANISLAVKCPNVEAWSVDGVTVPVTVRMTDRFSNPVPDGTTANFQTTLGGIGASCQTGSDTPGSGSCQVNWVSKDPRHVFGNPQSTLNSTPPANSNITSYPYYSAYCPSAPMLGQNNTCNGDTNGRSAIMVTAIGEESFKDATGSGVFNTTADTVAWNANDADNDFANTTNPKPWFDTSEPFLNQFEVYDKYGTPYFFSGEPFIDFNNNGKHDGPDGFVQSALCQGSLCSTTGDSVSIYAENLIILASSTAYFKPASGTAITLSAPISVGITIADINNQQMPAGTTVQASIPSQTGSIVGSTTYTWPCSSAVGGATWIFNLQPPQGAAVQPGLLIITVTSPGGVVTTAQYPVSG